MACRIAEPAHLLQAMRTSLKRGGDFLVNRIAPYGPILREPNLSYMHKAAWGMYAAGVDHDVIARLLDWAVDIGLRDNGDFYIAGEAPEYKDLQRVYRPLTFGKVAAWIGHPLTENQKVIDRLLQYQHRPSGGAFHYIGDDPDHVDEQETIGSLNTTFFGHMMLALDLQAEATAAADWVRGWVEANREHMADGRMYTAVTPGGALVTDVGPGERIIKLVDLEAPKQEFWQVGTAMAYLAVVYDTMRTRWNRPEQDARGYLDIALELLDFEARMPLETYLWPSKCKVAWGAGEVLRVLVEHGVGIPEQIDRAYGVAERVAVYTFMDNQFANGGWPCMHYPLADDIPELAFSYKPLGDTVRVPPTPIEGSQTIWLPGEELTGEFLGEMHSIERGVTAWLQAGGGP